MISDIDECLNENLTDCDIHARCINLKGSFDCACNAGYSGTGRENQCSMFIGSVLVDLF